MLFNSKARRLAFLFKSSPYGSAPVREGVEALIAATALNPAWGIFFIGEGVLHLLPNPVPAPLPHTPHGAMLKMLSLFEEGERFVCQRSLTLQQVTLTQNPLRAVPLQPPDFRARLRHYTTFLTF